MLHQQAPQSKQLLFVGYFVSYSVVADCSVATPDFWSFHSCSTELVTGSHDEHPHRVKKEKSVSLSGWLMTPHTLSVCLLHTTLHSHIEGRYLWVCWALKSEATLSWLNAAELSDGCKHTVFCIQFKNEEMLGISNLIVAFCRSVCTRHDIRK